MDFIRDKSPYEFLKSIIYPFFIKTISIFFKDNIDKKLIILGCYSGRLYTDNSKYLFEFLNKKTDYKAVWISKNKSIINYLKSLKHDVVSFYSLRAMKLLRKAKYIFLTHGIPDILPVKISSKTTVILTWHGTPIKKINIDLEKTYAYSKWATFLHLNLRFDDYVHFLLTPTKKLKEHRILCSAFEISLNKILPLGYPRNDILLTSNEDFKNQIKIKYNIPASKERILLYAPTFREDYIFKFPLNEKELNNLDKLLNYTNSIFLIKGHMFEKVIDTKKLEHIKYIEKDADIQELLVIADVLITDYSSMFFDYLLLDRPILLFTYDLEDYVKKRGMYYDFKEIAPGPLLHNGKELIEAIKNINNIDIEYSEKRKLIQERFNKYIDGKSTERLLKFLNIKYHEKKSDSI